MAQIGEFVVNTQDSSIYSGLLQENCIRRLKIYFAMPSYGVNEKTGICLLIAGFGAYAQSKVYRKMREEFADQYNLVVVQCDYFGWEFMQANDKMKQMADQYEGIVQIVLGETKENFADMGLLQAIDNITAVLSMIKVLYNNGKIFNTRKVIVYGQSQGAYLAYLCNAFAPGLFTLLIDNSAWLYPLYVELNRICYGKIVFKYLANSVLDDKDILKLPLLYQQVENKCKIMSYHGVDDTLAIVQDKVMFLKKVECCSYHEITADKVDGVIFKSTDHGLGADFLALFALVMSDGEVVFEESKSLTIQKYVTYNSTHSQYVIDYTNVLPKIDIKKL